MVNYMLEELKDETLIICPNSYKNEILEFLTNNKLIINIKIMSFNEYKRNYYFDYDIKTIKYLYDKYGMKIENIKELIENLYYIEDKKYNNSKLDYLVSIKKELDDNNLLIYNPYFKKYLNWKKIVYGYGEISEFELKSLTDAKIYSYESIEDNRKYKILHANDIKEECEYVFNKIVDLLNDGVDINNIYLMNVDSEYTPYLKRFSKYYGININILNNEKLIGTVLGTNFYNLILDHKSHNEIYEYLDKNRDEEIFSNLLSILNKYIEYDLYEVRDLIYDELESTSVPSKKYKNVINIKRVFDKVNKDDYIFLMNFNNTSIPVLYNDIDYITDDIKELVKISNTIELNRISRENTKNYIDSIKNIFISYKDKTPFNTYLPSTLLDNMNYEEISYTKTYNYSDDYNKSLFIEKLDNYVKYGEYDKDLEILYKTYGNLNYKEYDNSFDGIKKDELIDYLDNKLTLSYSHINNYYECAFKYYLTNILKVNLYDETFMTIIGNLFHDILCHMNDDDFNFDDSYANYIKDYEFTNKERFFIEKLKPDLLFIIETIKEFNKLTGLNKELHEEKINIKLLDKPEVTFKGFVDKIMYADYDGKTLVSIIDYKTGNIDINIKKIVYGLSMQLPVYLYLIKKSDLFMNPYIVGFYLEHILDNEIKRDKNKTYEEQKKNNLKLSGYSTNNQHYLSIFDSSYEDSNMISGVKIKKDGELASSAHALSEEEIDSIVNIVDKNIKEAVDEILNGKFDINPKIIDGKNESCTFCKYKDICYLRESNKVYINTEEGEDDVNRESVTSD